MELFLCTIAAVGFFAGLLVSAIYGAWAAGKRAEMIERWRLDSKAIYDADLSLRYYEQLNEYDRKWRAESQQWKERYEQAMAMNAQLAKAIEGGRHRGKKQEAV